MMPSWCRQVNWGKCGIPWVNCAVLCVKDDWKGQFWGLLLPVKTAHFTFSVRYDVTSKIAQFNWECNRRFPLSRQATPQPVSSSLPCTTLTSAQHSCFNTLKHLKLGLFHLIITAWMHTWVQKVVYSSFLKILCATSRWWGEWSASRRGPFTSRETAFGSHRTRGWMLLRREKSLAPVGIRAKTPRSSKRTTYHTTGLSELEVTIKQSHCFICCTVTIRGFKVAQIKSFISS
jgi:hypothetical protein